MHKIVQILLILTERAYFYSLCSSDMCSATTIKNKYRRSSASERIDRVACAPKHASERVIQNQSSAIPYEIAHVNHVPFAMVACNAHPKKLPSTLRNA